MLGTGGGRTRYVARGFMLAMLLDVLSSRAVAQTVTPTATSTLVPTATATATSTRTPFPTPPGPRPYGNQGTCKYRLSTAADPWAWGIEHIGPVCNTDADCPESQLPDPLTFMPLFDQSGQPVLSQIGTCPSWKCMTCKVSPNVGAVCRTTFACSSDADCPPSVKFDAIGRPVFDANGNPLLTQSGTCPPGFCLSDCNNDGRVTVDDVLTTVNIALGNAQASTCYFSDLNHDGKITVDEVLTGVNTALNGCQPPATPTATPARFVDNGDGTISDVQTGLMWEKKSDDGSIHDKDDLYTLGSCGEPPCTPDGTAFTVFLKALNDGNFAGYTDWRLPTVGELSRLVDVEAWAFGGTAPYVVAPFNMNCSVGCTVDGAGSTSACSCTAARYLSISQFPAVIGGRSMWFSMFYDFDSGTGIQDSPPTDGLHAARAVRGRPPGWGGDF